MMFLNFIYFFIGCLITFPLTHIFMKKGMMLDYDLTLEKQKDLSTAIKRARFLSLMSYTQKNQY